MIQQGNVNIYSELLDRVLFERIYVIKLAHSHWVAAQTAVNREYHYDIWFRLMDEHAQLCQQWETVFDLAYKS